MRVGVYAHAYVCVCGRVQFKHNIDINKVEHKNNQNRQTILSCFLQPYASLAVNITCTTFLFIYLFIYLFVFLHNFSQK